MIINVAQLLKSPVGTSKKIEFETKAQIDDAAKCDSKYKGILELTRIDKGILIKGFVNIKLDMICSRCLIPFVLTLNFKLSAEFSPTIDIITGLPLPGVNDPDVFTIDEHHQIDLTESMRQYLIVNIPMKPLCKPECAGLCVQCGKNLNDGKCYCKLEHTNPVWAGLKEL